jgi:DNA-binding NarL/FixJ family response regulator
VLIVADDPLTRVGLTALLADGPGFVIVGEAAGDADLPASLDAHAPDLLVWDLGWDPAPALDRLSELAGISAVVLLADPTFAADAWDAGARGLLSRDADVASLMAAMAAVSEGLVALDAALAVALLPSRGRAPLPLLEELTPRELEVLQLLAEGLPNKTIGHRLGISEHTVKFHVNSIMGKLDAQSRTEAVVQATRLGLILL